MGSTEQGGANGLLRRGVGAPIMWARDGLARVLIRVGVTPDVLTLVGLPVNVLAGLLFAWGWFAWGAAAAAGAGLFDIMDGAVARVSGRQTKFGAFLDSTIDRYSDVVLLAGVGMYYVRSGETGMVVVTLAALAGSLVTSYARARAESFMPNCKVGLFERGERTGYLIIGALVGNLRMALWVLAVMANVTVLVRMRYTWQRLNGKTIPPAKGLGGMLYHVVFWDFERGSLPYDAAFVVFALLVILARL